jgi:hypothetical protein
MSLSRSLSERNEHEKFKKSLGIPLSHLSNPTPSKVQRAKPPPSIFAISRPPSELMVLSMHTVLRRKKGYLGGIFRGG